MKVECGKEKLKEVVFIAERASGKNLALPILNSVMLEAKGSSLQVKATNLDIGFEVDIPAKVEQEGAVALNASVLGGFLGNLYQEDKVRLELVNDNINVSTPNSSTIIKSYPIDDFPLIPRIENTGGFTIEAPKLVSGIKAVIYAASVSDIKPEISSVYLYQDNTDLVFVATDSFRLAEKRIPLDRTGMEFMPIILPIKNAAEIARIFENNSDTLSVESNKHQLSIYGDDIHVTSRVIDGIYPDYRQIMPKNFDTEAVIDKDEFARVLKLSNIFSDRFHQISLKLLKDKKVEINSSNQDVGQHTASLKAQTKGGEVEMSFNGKYILDCFPTIQSGDVRLGFNERNKPMLIQSLGDHSFRYIVMPINR